MDIVGRMEYGSHDGHQQDVWNVEIKSQWNSNLTSIFSNFFFHWNIVKKGNILSCLKAKIEKGDNVLKCMLSTTSLANHMKI